MTTYFDGVAADYDLSFTNTEIGRLQRNQVWSYLSQRVLGKRKMNILEFNCGTGEDALWLSSLGHTVVATDTSKKMIEMAREKSAGTDTDLTFAFSTCGRQQSFQVKTLISILSNFGGLNCLSPAELKDFLGILPDMLVKGGRFVAVIMPDFCATESAYFLLKLDFNRILRRRKEKLSAKNDFGQTSVWYHSPAFVQRSLTKNLIVTGLRGIGTFVPPSFVEEKVKAHSGLLATLDKADGFLSSYSGPAYFSDHYLVDIIYE